MRLALRSRLHIGQVVVDTDQAEVGIDPAAVGTDRVVDLVVVAHSLGHMERLAGGSPKARQSPGLAAPGCSLAVRKAAEEVHLVADMENLILHQITLRIIWRSSLDSRDCCWYGPGGP